LRAEHLRQPPVVAAAYAITVRAQVAILTTFAAQIKATEEQLEAQGDGRAGRGAFWPAPGH
jgi:hypothetical protein